jgi:lysophospholipase L1-like esterase
MRTLGARRMLGLGLLGRPSSDSLSYQLLDLFLSDVAAGSVHNSIASDGVNVRFATDTEGTKLVVANQEAAFTPRSPAVEGDPGLWWQKPDGSGWTRTAGLILTARVVFNSTLKYCAFGWDNDKSTFPGIAWLAARGTNTLFARQGGSSVGVGLYAQNVPYDVAWVLRAAAGSFMFIKGGDYTSPTLLWPSLYANGATVYPCFETLDGGPKVRRVSIPVSTWLPSPLLSDGFSGATSDGAGHAETTGIGSGGGGMAWTDFAGTFGVSAGKLSCSVLATGIGLHITSLATAHVLHQVDLTFGTTGGGVVVRSADAQNYVYAKLINDGAYKVTLRKVVAGVDSEVLAPTAVTYSAGAPLGITADGAEYRVYYNYLGVGAAQTIADMNGTGVGVIALDTNTTFDNGLTYARGKEGQYSALNPFFPSVASDNIFCLGDSKTLGVGDEYGGGGYPFRMSSGTHEYLEIPLRVGVGGITVAGMRARIGSDLPVAVGTPRYVLINLGSNDLAGALPAEATWKADYQYILSAIHAKWPNAIILLSKPVYLQANAPSTPMATTPTLHGWIDALIAANSYCDPGPDETQMEGGNGYATYITDRTHPNARGYQFTADAWVSAIAGW